MTDMHNLPLERRILGPILAEKARTESDRPYMTVDGRTYSFAETDRLVRQLGRGMRRIGVRRQDLVTMLLPNGAEFVLSWYACCVVGAVMVPINTTYTGYMLDYILKDSGARGLIVDRRLAPGLAGLPEDSIRKLEWVAVVGGTKDLALPDGPGRYLDFADLLLDGTDDPEVPCTFRDIHSVMYTSGTTGPSKGVVIPNGHFFSSTMTFMRALGLNRDDVLFTPLPLFHGLASRLGVLPALMAGAHVVIAEKFSATQFWKQVVECGATVAHTIFTIPPILKAQPPSHLDRAHKLRAMYNASSDPEFEARFNVRLVEAYGLTETGLTIYTHWPERREGSCGKAHEDWEIDVVDDNGLPVDAGETGELVCRPKLPAIMMDGYLNKPEETLRTMKDLWFRCGDYVRRDADGYFYFSGRKKERIRRRGENVSGFEVERIVGMHPDVSEVAALPYPAEVGEDDIRCVIIRRTGATLAPGELMDWLQPRMPFFMLPRYIEFVDDMPRTPSAKIEKYKLVEAGLSGAAWDRDKAGYRIERGSSKSAA
jgi:carnitine-CoA ligase